MAEIVKLGSLYLNGKVQDVGVKYNDEEISFGPAVPGKELYWVKVNDTLIADRCICLRITWYDLDNRGFVFGVPIQIDGNVYLCRCLRAGSEEAVPNEWDAALTAVGESNNLWHWEKEIFWGQDSVDGVCEFRANRGRKTARCWGYNTPDCSMACLGWRPVLEPLGPASVTPERLLNKEVQVFGPDYIILDGILQGVDDYDLALRTTDPLPDNCVWAKRIGNRVIVDRPSALWVKEKRANP